jgi:hypothetical protein
MLPRKATPPECGPPPPSTTETSARVAASPGSRSHWDITTMAFLSNSSVPFKSELCLSSTGSCPANWRAWWQAEAFRQGSDWPSIIAAHLTIVDQLRGADDADAQIRVSP